MPQLFFQFLTIQHLLNSKKGKRKVTISGKVHITFLSAKTQYTFIDMFMSRI